MRPLAIVLLLTLSGCASISDSQVQALQNLQHCDRQYTAAMGMGATGTLTITCKARPFE